METNTDHSKEEPVQDQIAEYHADINQIQLEGYALRVRKARNALFWAAALIFVAEVVVYASSAAELDPLAISFIVIVSSAFVALGLWTKKRPFTAIVSGLILFILYILLVAIVNGYAEGAIGVIKGLFGGWIFKILIFVALIKHLQDAKELQKALDEKKA